MFNKKRMAITGIISILLLSIAVLVIIKSDSHVQRLVEKVNDPEVFTENAETVITHLYKYSDGDITVYTILGYYELDGNEFEFYAGTNDSVDDIYYWNQLYPDDHNTSLRIFLESKPEISVIWTNMFLMNTIKIVSILGFMATAAYTSIGYLKYKKDTV